MPQKPLGKAGKSLSKKVIPPSRQSAKISKQRKGARTPTHAQAPREPRFPSLRVR
jgi:hypothetical protein